MPRPRRESLADPAQELFDEFVERGYNRIVEARETKESEGQFLDFKGFSDPKSMRKVFAKAASAFANSEGGVIVWGIDSRPPKPGEPAEFNSEQPTDQLVEELIRLNDATNQILSYVPKGIRSHPIPIEAGSSRGLIATLVPDSDIKPHMSTVEDCYYYRSGSNTFPMRHGMVEALVLARRSPKFVLHMGKPCLLTEGSGKLAVWAVPVHAENVGRVSARNVDCYVTSRPQLNNYLNLVGASPRYIQSIEDDGGRVFPITFDREFAYHPQARIGLVQVNLPFFNPDFDTATIVLRVFADDYAGRFVIELTKPDFVEHGVMTMTHGDQKVPFKHFRTLEPAG